MSKLGITNLEFHDFIYTWIIADIDPNFRNYCQTITSPVFSTDNTRDNIVEKFELQLGLRESCIIGFLGRSERYVCLKCSPTRRGNRDANVTIRFSFVNRSNEEVFEKKVFGKLNKEIEVSYSTFLKEEMIDFNQLITNENLTIKCRIRFHNGVSHAEQPDTKSFIVPRPSILDDLKNLRFTTDLSDMKLIVNKEEFPVHKSILAARSPVFSTMFRIDMREKKENTANIVDIEPRVMKEVLNFIYTDKVNIDSAPIKDLLAAADKYQIEGLRIICLEAIVSRMSIDNVIEVLAITDRYGIPALQDHAINFLASNRADIVAKKNWDEIVKSLPQPLLVKLTTVLMQKK